MFFSSQISKFLGFTAIFFLTASFSEAQSYATEPRTEKAMGHYSRARAMLIEALAEFDEGIKSANPDLLVNSEKWRLSVISRTEDLNKLLDPKPRVSRHGARFKASPLKVRRERTKFQESKETPTQPYSVNYAGEEDFYKKQHEKESIKAQTSEEALPSAMIEPRKNVEELPKKEAINEASQESVPPAKNTKNLENFSSKVVENATKAVPLQIEAQPMQKGPSNNNVSIPAKKAPVAQSGEESDISKAIESVIKNRFEELKKEGPGVKQ